MATYTYFVDGDDGDDSNDGESWADAFATVGEVESCIRSKSNNYYGYRDHIEIIIKYGTYQDSFDAYDLDALGSWTLWYVTSDTGTHTTYDSAVPDPEQCVIDANNSGPSFIAGSGNATTHLYVKGIWWKNGNSYSIFRAQKGGGGTYGNIVLEKCIIEGASSTIMFQATAGSVYLDNVLIYGCSDGDFLMLSYNARWRHVTFVDHSPGGLFTVISSAGSGEFYNCIFKNVGYSESSLNDAGDYYNCRVPYSGLSGSGNITDEPEFIDESVDDYRLKITSPCLEAGDNGNSLNEDIRDKDRPWMSKTCDIGSYEMQYKMICRSLGIGEIEPVDRINDGTVMAYNTFDFGSATVYSGGISDAIVLWIYPFTSGVELFGVKLWISEYSEFKQGQDNKFWVESTDTWTQGKTGDAVAANGIETGFSEANGVAIEARNVGNTYDKTHSGTSEYAYVVIEVDDDEESDVVDFQFKISFNYII